MVKVPTASSSGVSLRDRALVLRSCASRAICVSALRPASRMTGTMSQSSMATATPMLTWRYPGKAWDPDIATHGTRRKTRALAA